MTPEEVFTWGWLGTWAVVIVALIAVALVLRWRVGRCPVHRKGQCLVGTAHCPQEWRRIDPVTGEYRW